MQTQPEITTNVVPLPIKDAPGTRREGNRPNALPLSLPPRGLNRIQAAAYIGVSPNTFDRMVEDGTMPRSKQVYARKVWDRFEIDEAFVTLSCEDNLLGNNELDRILGTGHEDQVA